MMHRFSRAGLLASAALLMVSGCSRDRSATAPVAAVTASAQQNLSLISLLPCAQTTAYSASKVIGPAGGVLRIGPHSLRVPAGALSDTVTITGTAPIGIYTSVEFQPQGLQFATPVRVSISYASCGLLDISLLKVVYVSPSLDILRILHGSVNSTTKRVVGKTTHFSSYMIAH